MQRGSESLPEEALDSLSAVDDTVADFDNILDQTTVDFEGTGFVSLSGELTSEQLELFTAIVNVRSQYVEIASMGSRTIYLKRFLMPWAPLMTPLPISTTSLNKPLLSLRAPDSSTSSRLWLYNNYHRLKQV